MAHVVYVHGLWMPGEESLILRLSRPRRRQGARADEERVVGDGDLDGTLVVIQSDEPDRKKMVLPPIRIGAADRRHPLIEKG